MSIGAAILALAALALAAAVTGWVRHLALRRAWLDVPNARSSHGAPTPRGGGIGIVAASTLAFLGLGWAGGIDRDLLLALLGGLAVAWIGFRDDRRPVSAGVRLVVHLAAAAWALAWLGGVPPIRFGSSVVEFGVAGYVLGALAIGWTLNLFNFMDGIDGIAAGEATFMALAGGWLAHGASIAGVPAASIVFGAACLGFLLWNWPPARIFMGDVGSGYLGYVLAVLALATMRQSLVALFVWLALGGVFFVDATVTLVRRALRGERPHEAHRSHAYQWLSRAWKGHRPVTLAVLAINVVVLLPLAWLCLRYPGAAAGLVAAGLGMLAILVLAAGAGRAEAPPDAARGVAGTSKE